MNRYVSMLLIWIGPLSVSCGGVGQSDYVEDNDSATTFGRMPVRDRGMVQVSVGVRAKPSHSFSLTANATAFSINIDSCASGYTSTVTEANANPEVYKFDLDCLVKLTQFEINGSTYEPDVNFTTWLANDTATFENTLDANDKLTVTVISTLSSPIDENDTIVLQFSSIEQGVDHQIGEAVVGQDHTIEVSGQTAPFFEVDTVTLVGITAGGAGQFTFLMNCLEAINGAGDARACRDVEMLDIDYRLVEDTYVNPLTAVEAAAIFDGSEDAVLSAHLQDAPATANGGFITVTLDGPDEMHNTNEMILILRAAELSYQWFRVEVQTVSQD